MSVAKSLENMRREYSGQELSESNVSPDPLRQFGIWFEEAIRAEVPDPHAMALATVSEEGMPSVRFVLLRGLEMDGFTFYTNYESRKAQELRANANAALAFFWQELDRQIRIEGEIAKVAESQSDKYFASRPRASQIAAWASNQSTVISGRDELDRRFREIESKFDGQPVPRPGNWGGFNLKPRSIEFWQGRPGRLHDRILYTLTGDDRWEIKRLAP